MGIISSLLRKNVDPTEQSVVQNQVPESEPRNVQSEITNVETNGCSIFKIPEQHIRDDNVQSFHPKILSIGPYYHGSSHLEGMERTKLSCRCRIFGCNSENYHDRDEIRGIENRARSFYSENVTMEPENFAKMLLVDGCFILAALTGMTCRGTTSSDTVGHRGGCQNQVDLNQQEQLNRHAIVHDLLLVENQIPFFVLEEINKLAAGEGETTESPKEKIATYVKGVLRHYPKAIEIPEICSKDFHHLLHLCHMFFRPNKNPVKTHHNQAVMNQWHRAMQYREAGVEFRVKDSSTPHSLLDVTFSNGLMKIPHLSIDAKTETIFSNLIMFEHDYPHAGKYINAYVTFMSQLLSDADDVKLLAREKIIQILGCEEGVVNIFSRLNGLAVFNPHGEDYYLTSTFQSVEAHYGCRFNWWMAWLKHNHLTNPCVATAALLGLLALLCTIIQQLLSILSHFKLVH